MKLRLFLSALLLSLITLGSCNKNYTCACTGTTGNTDVFTIKGGSRKKAETTCKNSYSPHYDSIPFSDRSCKIK